MNPVAALKIAKDTIRAFNGLGLSGEAEQACWDAYQHSPEMKQINAALDADDQAKINAPKQNVLKLTFIVTVEASASKIEKHLGLRSSKDLREGGPIYLNDLSPEFDYESSAIEKIERGGEITDGQTDN